MRSLSRLRRYADQPALAQLYRADARPIPPVVDPARMAEAIADLALRPRRALYIGAHHALALPYLAAPEPTRRLLGRLSRLHIMESGPRAESTAASLFTPVEAGTGIRGGWAVKNRQRFSLGGLALAGLLAAGARGWMRRR